MILRMIGVVFLCVGLVLLHEVDPKVCYGVACIMAWSELCKWERKDK